MTFTVNAARRFRYTLDIKKFEEQQKLKKDPASRLRAGTDVILVSMKQNYLSDQYFHRIRALK